MRDTDHRSALQGILQTVPCAAVGMDEKIHVCLCGDDADCLRLLWTNAGNLDGLYCIGPDHSVLLYYFHGGI